MNLIKKLIPFLFVFFLVFFFIRTNAQYNTSILLADIGGIPWLYTSVSTIFGIIAAFAIQKEWEQWNNIVDAVKGETDSLEKLYMWSNNFPENIRTKLHGDIKNYLRLIINDGWKFSEQGIRDERVEDTLKSLNGHIYDIFSEAPELMPTSFALLSGVFQHRSERLHYSSMHMPQILKNTLQFAAFLTIALSMFIGVNNIYLAFLFTASMASLVFALFIVLMDLDHPLRPGDWHVTTKDYEELLSRLEGGNKLRSE